MMMMMMMMMKHSKSLHATETGISSGLMVHLARMQSLPYQIVYSLVYPNKRK